MRSAATSYGRVRSASFLLSAIVRSNRDFRSTHQHLSALDPEYRTIHRQDCTAIVADALREFSRHALAGKQFPDRLHRREHLHAVGKKAMECVVPAKIQAKAWDFLHGCRDAPDAPLRAMDAMGYAIDALLFTPSMSGHTAIDRAIRTGRVGGAEMEAAKLLQQASFRLLEITEDCGGGLPGHPGFVQRAC